MVKLNKKIAFERMIANFGPWSGWGRAQHLAYGLVRGVEYSHMEKYANDRPPMSTIVRTLWKLGAWQESSHKPRRNIVRWLLELWKPSTPRERPGENDKLPPRACYDEVEKLVVWVRKPARELAKEAAE